MRKRSDPDHMWLHYKHKCKKKKKGVLSWKGRWTKITGFIYDTKWTDMGLSCFCEWLPFFDNLQCDAWWFGTKRERKNERQTLFRPLTLQTLNGLWLWIKMVAKARGKTQKDGAVDMNNENERLKGKQMELRWQTPLKRENKLNAAQYKKIK